jgi:hypothetical protein
MFKRNGARATRRPGRGKSRAWHNLSARSASRGRNDGRPRPAERCRWACIFTSAATARRIPWYSGVVAAGGGHDEHRRERRSRVALSFLGRPGDPVLGAALRTRTASELLAPITGSDAPGEAFLGGESEDTAMHRAADLRLTCVSHRRLWFLLGRAVSIPVPPARRSHEDHGAIGVTRH